MATDAALAQRIDDWVDANRERVVSLLRDLVRIPSENHPPNGAEREAQEHLCAALRDQGVAAMVYAIDGVPGLDAHPLRNPAVACAGRPNVVARRPGREPQTARSLLLSGHMDVVPAGAIAAWTRAPYGAQIEGTRLYGRGAYDMKGGVAVNAAVMIMLADLDLPLAGDVIMESVADEEFAGGHGTIAARLAGHQADAVLVPEPSNLHVYRAHRGLRVVRIKASGKGGLTFAGDRPEPAVHHLPALINGIIEFAETRNRNLKVPDCYRHNPSPANWMITKVRANEWADDALLAVPETAEIELFWETLPGETQAAVEGEFETWLAAFRARTGIRVEHQYSLRWMEGFETPAAHPFTRTAETQAAQVLGRETRAIGAPFPCDLFLFAKFGIDAGLIMGPSGNGAHAADEWVDIDSVLELVRIYGRIASDWCSQPRP